MKRYVVHDTTSGKIDGTLHGPLNGKEALAKRESLTRQGALCKIYELVPVHISTTMSLKRRTKA